VFCCAAVTVLTVLIVNGAPSQGRRVSTAGRVAPTPRTPPTTQEPRRVDPVHLATCSQTERGVLATPTQQAFIKDVVGDWLLCGTTSVFGTNEQGLEISPDGSWSKLTLNPAGRPVAMRGWGNQGAWSVVDTSAMNGPGTYQLNLKIDGEGTVITLPVFSSGPPKMRLSNEGVYTADYVPSFQQSSNT
jgi:hypothetical protein